jgi:hypothetical protein
MNSTLQTILIILLIAFVVFAVIGALTSKKTSKYPEWKVKAKSKSKQISSAMNINDDYALKSLLVDADKLLDYSLKSMRVQGETLGERLRNSSALFSKQQYQNIWSAHKLRNHLVHEIDAKVNVSETKEGIETLLEAVDKLVH